MYTGIPIMRIITPAKIKHIPLQMPPRSIPQLNALEMRGLETRLPTVSMTAIMP
jgi:hypothetical protein